MFLKPEQSLDMCPIEFFEKFSGVSSANVGDHDCCVTRRSAGSASLVKCVWLGLWTDIRQENPDSQRGMALKATAGPMR